MDIHRATPLRWNVGSLTEFRQAKYGGTNLEITFPTFLSAIVDLRKATLGNKVKCHLMQRGDFIDVFL